MRQNKMQNKHFISMLVAGCQYRTEQGEKRERGKENEAEPSTTRTTRTRTMNLGQVVVVYANLTQSAAEPSCKHRI